MTMAVPEVVDMFTGAPNETSFHNFHIEKCFPSSLAIYDGKRWNDDWQVFK
jgi:hypothetical protein